MFAKLALLVALDGAVTAQPQSAHSGWKHDWETPASAWWGYGAMGGRLFADDEVAFLASHYKIVLLSLCQAGLKVSSVSAGIMNVSAKLKKANPDVKVLQYWNTDQWACYQRTDPDYAAFLAHREWWLTDDFGNPVLTNGSPQYDWTNEQAVQHWLLMPIAGEDGTNLIDGFLLDGGAGFDQPANISSTRAETLKLAKWKAIGRMQQRLTAANNGLILANGMIGGPIDPHGSDPYNLGVLDYANGIENERGTPTFELVNHTSGAFLKDAVAANLAAIEQAGQMANGSKVVNVNYWPGPMIDLSKRKPGDNSSGWPIYAPGDKENRAPNGTKAQVVEGWQHMLTKWFPFNLAMFLSVAGESTYFTQSVWYASNQGSVACPADPDSCTAPSPFYPDMQRSLGPPLGPRTPVQIQQRDGTYTTSKYKWVRHFQHAVVTVDLDEPLGPGTSIVWN
jgi:hypothetical protein